MRKGPSSKIFANHFCSYCYIYAKYTHRPNGVISFTYFSEILQMLVKKTYAYSFINFHIHKLSFTVYDYDVLKQVMTF